MYIPHILNRHGTRRHSGRSDRYGARLSAYRVRRRAVSGAPAYPYTAALQHHNHPRGSDCTAWCPSGGYLLRHGVALAEWEPLQHASGALNHFFGECSETESCMENPTAGQGF